MDTILFLDLSPHSRVLKGRLYFVLNHVLCRGFLWVISVVTNPVGWHAQKAFMRRLPRETCQARPRQERQQSCFWKEQLLRKKELSDYASPLKRSSWEKNLLQDDTCETWVDCVVGHVYVENECTSTIVWPRVGTCVCHSWSKSFAKNLRGRGRCCFDGTACAKRKENGKLNDDFFLVEGCNVYLSSFD